MACVFNLFATPTPTKPASGLIPLRINNTAKNIPLPWQIYCGVPFSANLVKSAEQLRVVDASGKPVPFQSKILARWAGTESLRWVGFYFSGNPAKKYFVEYSQQLFPRKKKTKLSIKNPGLDSNFGTIEFYVKPDWNSSFLSPKRR